MSMYSDLFERENESILLGDEVFLVLSCQQQIRKVSDVGCEQREFLGIFWFLILTRTFRSDF